MEIIALSIGRGILDPKSREHERMRHYAREVSGLHVVVLCRREHGVYEPLHDGSLHVYPTYARTRLGMLVDAGCVAFRIIRNLKGKKIVLTAQDPFALGLLSFVLSRISPAHFHIQLHGDYWGGVWGKGSQVTRLKKVLAKFLLRRAVGVRVVSERIKASLVREGITPVSITVLPIRPEGDT
jgi:hypothetical protein